MGRLGQLGYATSVRPNFGQLFPTILIFFLFAFWSDRHDRDFQALGPSLDEPVGHLAKKPLDHPNQHLVIGCEDKLNVITQLGPDEFDRYLVFAAG